MNSGTDIVFVGDPHGQLVRAVEATLRMTERPKRPCCLETMTWACLWTSKFCRSRGSESRPGGSPATTIPTYRRWHQNLDGCRRQGGSC